MKTLSGKITALVSVVLFLSIMSLISVTSVFFTKKLKENSVQTLKNSATLLETEISDWLMQRGKILSTHNNSLNKTMDNIYNIDVKHLQVFEHEDQIMTIFVIFDDLKTRSADGWEAVPGDDVRTREYYVNAIKRNSLYYSNVYLDSDTKQMIITISRPLVDAHGKTRGIIAADVDLATIRDFFAKNLLLNGHGRAFLLDNQGLFISHYDEAFLAKSIDSSPYLQDIYSEYNKDGEVFSYINSYKNKSTLYMKQIPFLNWTLGIEVDDSYIYQDIVKFRLMFFSIGGIFLILFFPLVFFMTKRISRGLRLTTELFKNIAEGEGDLTLRLPHVGNDEIALLSTYFNKTLEKIADSIQSVISETSEMKVVGDTLSSSMDEAARVVQDISRTIDGIRNQVIHQSSGVEQTRLSISKIAENTKNLTAQIETQSANVIESSSSIEEMVANINSVTTTLENNAVAVERLRVEAESGREYVAHSTAISQKINDESEGLLEAISVIQRIAAQTNLLAMNAAIEAAHAGDSGKGFAVVASEIRKLAEESSGQGKTIGQVLKGLKQSIEAVSDNAKMVQKQFDTIFALTNTVSAHESSVMGAMQEQSSGNKQVLQAMHEINEITSQVKAGSSLMQNDNIIAEQEMKKLSEAITIITNGINEMASGTLHINGTIQDIRLITQKNRTGTENLATAVNKFKV